MDDYPEEWLEEDRKYLLEGELDDELKEALELTKEDLIAMLETGRPARLARREPRRIRKRRLEREAKEAAAAANRQRSV